MLLLANSSKSYTLHVGHDYSSSTIFWVEAKKKYTSQFYLVTLYDNISFPTFTCNTKQYQYPAIFFKPEVNAKESSTVAASLRLHCLPSILSSEHVVIECSHIIILLAIIFQLFGGYIV